MDEEQAPEQVEERVPEQAEAPEPPEQRPPEEMKIRPALRAGLVVFGMVVLLFGVLSLLGGRFEYADFVGQQVVAPLAIIVGAIMFFAGARGRIWA